MVTRIIYIVGIITVAVMILALAGMVIEYMKNSANDQKEDLEKD